MLARIRKSIEDNDEGFTLIELLVVIIIIGILAAIAIPVFLNQRKKGYQAGMKSDLRTVANEMETYYTDNQSYVGAIGGGTNTTGTLTQGSANTVGSDSITLSKGDVVTVTNSGVNGYCLKATSTQSSGTTYWYDSQNGGLQPSTATGCTATSF